MIVLLETSLDFVGIIEAGAVLGSALRHMAWRHGELSCSEYVKAFNDDTNLHSYNIDLPRTY